jgi:hypothetical protein
MDDHGNTPSTATLLPLSGSGFTLDGMADVDAFKVYLKANITYAFSVDAAASDMKLGILSTTGTALDSLGFITSDTNNASASGNATVAQRLFMPRTSGYYIVQASAAQAGGLGSHTLRWQATTEHDDYSASTATLGRLEMWGMATGVIDQPGQVDWLRIDLKGGTDYAFTLQGADSSAYTLGSGAADAQLAIYDSNGVQRGVTSSGGIGGDPRLTYQPAADGVYYVAVSDVTGKGTGTYAVLADWNNLGSTDDYAAGRSTTGVLTVGTPRTVQLEPWGNGYFGPYDADSLRVYLNAGTRYEISDTVGSVTVSDNFGREIAYTPMGGKLRYTPSESGYYVLVGIGSDAKRTDTVTAKVYDVADDYPDDTGTRVTLAPGVARQGTLDVAGDKDWFRVELNAGNRYDFTLEYSGASSASGWPYPDLMMQLYDGAGLMYTKELQRGPLQKFSITPAVGDVYYLSVVGDMDTRGNYKVSLARTDLVPPPVPVINLAPGAVSNHLELAGTAEPGATVVVEVDGAGIGNVIADINGSWAFSTVAGRLAAGSHSVVVHAMDADRNVSTKTGALPFTIDLTAPLAPTISVKPAGNGMVQAGGTAQAGVTVKLTATVVSGATQVNLGQATAGADGKWLINVNTAALADGTYDFKAVAASTAGNLSPGVTVAGLALYVHQFAAPAVDALSALPAMVQRQSVSLSGTAQAHATVQALDGDKVVASSPVVDGRWTLDLKLAEGAHKLTLRSLDFLDNQSAAVTMAVTVDTQAPATPSWNSDAAGGASGSNQLQLTGQAEAGSMVRVLDGSRVLGEVTADSHGAWSLKTPALPNGSHVISVTARDAAGWESGSATQTIAVQSTQNMAGTDGADRFVLTPGSHVFDGGAGVDTLAASGLRGVASVKKGAEGVTLTWQDGASVLLQNVERVVFADGALAFDTGAGQTGGMAYRLYQAAFDRAPDAAGLGYWLAQMDKGTALRDVAAAFVASKEFAALTGGDSIGNQAFAGALYRNVLHRAPDQAGLDYWVGVLDGGASRGDVLASFGESPENIAQLVGIANGFPYQPYTG